MGLVLIGALDRQVRGRRRRLHGDKTWPGHYSCALSTTVRIGWSQIPQFRWVHDVQSSRRAGTQREGRRWSAREDTATQTGLRSTRRFHTGVRSRSGSWAAYSSLAFIRIVGIVSACAGAARPRGATATACNSRGRGIGAPAIFLHSRQRQLQVRVRLLSLDSTARDLLAMLAPARLSRSHAILATSSPDRHTHVSDQLRYRRPTDRCRCRAPLPPQLPLLLLHDHAAPR